MKILIVNELLNAEHASGTIVKAHLTNASADELHNWCQNNKIKDGLEPEDYHCTILFSKNPVPHLMEINNIDFHAIVKIKRWKILGDALVLLLEARKFHKLHNRLMDEGGTHDFPNFLPHVSVKYDVESDKLPQNLPDFDLKFDRLSVEPIDPNYSTDK